MRRMAGIKVVGEVYFDLDYTDDAHIVVERKKTEKKLDNIANRVRRYVHRSSRPIRQREAHRHRRPVHLHSW